MISAISQLVTATAIGQTGPREPAVGAWLLRCPCARPGRSAAGDSERGEPRVPCRAGGRLLSRLHRRGVATPDCCSHAPPAARDVLRRRWLRVIRANVGKRWIARPRLMLCLCKQRCCTSRPTSSCTDSRTAPAMQRSRARRRDERSSSNASASSTIGRSSATLGRRSVDDAPRVTDPLRPDGKPRAVTRRRQATLSSCAHRTNRQTSRRGDRSEGCDFLPYRE